MEKSLIAQRRARDGKTTPRDLKLDANPCTVKSNVNTTLYKIINLYIASVSSLAVQDRAPARSRHIHWKSFPDVVYSPFLSFCWRWRSAWIAKLSGIYTTTREKITRRHQTIIQLSTQSYIQRQYFSVSWRGGRLRTFSRQPIWLPLFIHIEIWLFWSSQLIAISVRLPECEPKIQEYQGRISLSRCLIHL